MMAGHRTKLRRIRLASIQLAGWTIRPDQTHPGWIVVAPDGAQSIALFPSKERATAFVEDRMVKQGLLKGRYFNGYR